MFSRDDSARAPPFSSKDSRAYEATRAGVRTGPESARRILIMRAKLWASSRRWNICVFAGRGLWLNYHSLFPLRAVDLRRPLPAPRESQRHPTFPSLPSPFFPRRIVFTFESDLWSRWKKFSKRRAKKEKYYQHYNLWIFQIICSNPAIIPRNRISNRLFISYNRLSTRVKITILILLNQSEYLQMRIMKDFWIIV